MLAKIRDQKDLLITEKAAKDIITQLSISVRPTETLSQKYPGFCYQDYLIKHFMEQKGFDLSSAGRTKINHKLRVTERLYQKVLAADILSKTGKVFLKKDTLINKKEIDMIKKAITDGDLFLEQE
ncbi:MAG: hypothetical protein MJ219_04295 [Mycoplasmoidaceae bacterium]|nr:hypothetical protein [Mycoplasmoidaceae bacterium]